MRERPSLYETRDETDASWGEATAIALLVSLTLSFYPSLCRSRSTPLRAPTLCRVRLLTYYSPAPFFPLACSFTRSTIPLVPLALRTRRKQPLARRATVFACGETGVRVSATSGRERESGWLSLSSSFLLSSLLFSPIRGLCTMSKTSAHLLSRKESKRRRAGWSQERERVGACVHACAEK
jgi:hypothetical protein